MLDGIRESCITEIPGPFVLSLLVADVEEIIEWGELKLVGKKRNPSDFNTSVCLDTTSMPLNKLARLVQRQ